MDSITIKGVNIRILKADITTLKVDAIVNAANNKLVMGGGVAGAIRKKGGQIIEDEAVKKGPIKIGESAYTSAGKLPSKYVIHAATMGMDFETDEYKVRAAAKSALKLANELKLNSLAFSALGCGVGGFPTLAAAKIMAQEVLKAIREDGTTLKEIIFCVFSDEAKVDFEKGGIGYLNYFTNILKTPYLVVDAIIEVDGGIVAIERSNPPFGWALPGGFVDYGETLENAVVREAKEETGLDIFDVKQFHAYSTPDRDPRFHIVSMVFSSKAKGKPKAGDDAKGVKVVKFDDIAKSEFACDHKQILLEWMKSRKVIKDDSGKTCV